jgi:DNA-3-methyladenine glycosylase I
METAQGPIAGPDGRRRCPWALSSPDYVAYHDSEWGRPVLGDDALFERLSLEGFQAGLAWITILRKREGFRAAFAGFELSRVAAFDGRDVRRLLADASIVRNRQKILATIENAKRTLELIDETGSLAALLWEFRPPRRRAPRRLSDLEAQTPESKALSRELKSRGFRFVGPTTVYAAMQAAGLVNDHLVGCHVRAAVTEEQRAAARSVASRAADS